MKSNVETMGFAERMKGESSMKLSFKNIGDEGAKAIGEALKSNKTLTNLDVRHNKIQSEGAKAIGRALKSNKTLTSLNLQSNEIEDEGMQAIGEALKSNRTLTSLVFGPREIGYAESRTREHLLDRNLNHAQSFEDSFRAGNFDDLEEYFERGGPRLYKDQT